MTGHTSSKNFPTTENPYQSVNEEAGSVSDAFVTKFDPSGSTLAYSTYLGGSAEDYGKGIAVDSNGCAYITGDTFSTDFPAYNAYQGRQARWDAFVVKLDSSGSALAYSTYLGGSDCDYGNGIAVDSNGCAYVIGDTKSTDFPTRNPFQQELKGSSDAFVAKLSSSGSTLAYSTYLGGRAEDKGKGIAVDSNGCAYITGYTYSTDFPVENAFQPSQGDGGTPTPSDAFVAKLSSSGSTLAYSTYLGGRAEDKGNGIAVDSGRCAYVTGYTYSTDFPVENAFQPSHGDGRYSDAFVTKLFSSGRIEYSTYLGGSAEDGGNGIAVDPGRCAYVTGHTHSIDFPSEKPIQGSYGKYSDAFVTKLSSSGSTVAYSTHLGGDANEEGFGIAVDSSGNAYLTGYTGSKDFPIENAYRNNKIDVDAFVTKINADGPIVPIVPVQVPLYFPHVETNDPWQTEIAIINTSSDQPVTGTLKGFSNAGRLIDTIDNNIISLSPRGRMQLSVADKFTNGTDIGYIVFQTDSDTVRGYTKFYREGLDRAAIPAVNEDEVNTSDIYVPHIASNTDWWTKISLVNTTSAPKDLIIIFNVEGQKMLSKTVSLAANGHKAFTISELFGGQPQPDIQSAVITNAKGIIGLELFGGGQGDESHLDGLLLTDDRVSTVYYPHVASDTDWWTGIVAYNLSDEDCTITITPYTEGGISLTTSSLSLGGKENNVCSVALLNLPDKTAWFKMGSTRPLISGFELFGTNNGSQLAAYAGISGEGAKEGIFAKIEKNGWTGIAFVNTEDSAASVTLTAYDDSGAVIATQNFGVGAHTKEVAMADVLFSPQDITSATYITYSSDRNIVGFQLNGYADGTMLDGLPAL